MDSPRPHAETIFAGLAGLGLGACSDDPPPPDEVRARLSTDLAHVLRETNAALAGSADAMPGAAALGMLERALGQDTVVSARLHTALAGFAGRGARGARPADEPYDPSEDIAVLNTRIFSDENYLGDGIYKVSASLACGEASPECAIEFDKAQVRVRVSERGGQLRFALQLGADHVEPLTIGLDASSLQATIDLDEAMAAAAALAQLAGEALPNLELSGELTGWIEIVGTAHARLEVSIDRAIEVAFADEGVALDSAAATRITSAKARLLALDLDGAARRGSFALGLGATTAHLVATDDFDTETLDLDLPGLTATASFAAGAPLELTGLSLGDRATTVDRNGARAITIDLNPDAGRALGATITRDASSGRETIAVSPLLDVRVAVDHAVLGDEAPIYDVTQLRLEGSVRAAADSDALEVVTGSLRMVTNPAHYGFDAAAGQCVSAEEVEDLPSGRFYTRWTAGACL